MKKNDDIYINLGIRYYCRHRHLGCCSHSGQNNRQVYGLGETGRRGRMIDLEFGVSYDGMRIGDKELVDCINALREIGFSDEEIQKKLDECKVKDDEL